MSRVVAGTLLLPNGQPMANASIYFTAKRTEPVSIVEGSNTFFNTNGAGVYSQSVVNGFYAVSIEYIADASGAYMRRWQLGDVFIETGAASTLEALIIASNPPSDLPLTLLYEILAEAQQAATDAEAAATAAAASAASITVGTGPTNIPNTTILNTRLGTAGNLGTAAQQATGAFATAAQGVKADSAIQTAGLNTRLGTSGNLGTIAQQNANAVAVTGGTINSTSIGATTRSTGAFTSLVTSVDAGFGIAPDGAARVQSSNGIKLGNSANANTVVLDWYEEGTFTPTVFGATTAGTATYGLQVGRYQRVGNRVHIQLFLQWSAATGTGNLRVGGLPFTSNNSTSNTAVANLYRYGLAVSAGYILQGFVFANRTAFEFDAVDAAGATVNYFIAAAGNMAISVTYEV